MPGSCTVFALVLAAHALTGTATTATPSTPSTAASSLLGSACPRADSIPEAEVPEWIGGRPWHRWTRMTGDWAGARDALTAAGLHLGAETLAEVAAGPAGAASLQLSRVGVALETAGGRVRGVAELYAKAGREELPGFAPGHGLSSADAPDFVAAGEAWLEVASGEGALRLRAGRVDANAEFAASAASSEFVNPSFGLSPALDHLPSYPAPAPAATAFLGAWAGVEAGVGVFAAPAGGLVAVAQLAGTTHGRRPVEWALGLVGGEGAEDGGDGPAPGSGPGVQGAFARLEGAGGGLTPFVSAAISRWGVATATRHLSLGATVPLTWSGAGSAGLAGSWIRAADPGAGPAATSDELLVEAYLTLAPVAWLVVQPDVQLTAPLDGSAPLRAAGVLRLALRY